MTSPNTHETLLAVEVARVKQLHAEMRADGWGSPSCTVVFVTLPNGARASEKIRFP